MEINAIRAFVLVAGEGNPTRAAVRCHTTPFAVSAHLRQLEDHLGVTLFNLSRRAMELTDHGEHLLEPARRVIAAGRDPADTAARLRGAATRVVRLGLNGPPEHLHVGPLMTAAARGEPPLSVELVTIMRKRVIGDVESGRLDAGFIYGPADVDRFAYHHLARRRMRVAVPGRMAIDAVPDAPEARAALPWIWPGARDCPFRAVMSEILGPAEPEARVVTRVDDPEAIRALVRAGMGVGLLEERYGQEGTADGCLRLLEPSWEIDLGLIHRRDRLPRRGHCRAARCLAGGLGDRRTGSRLRHRTAERGVARGPGFAGHGSRAGPDRPPWRVHGERPAGPRGVPCEGECGGRPCWQPWPSGGVWARPRRPRIRERGSWSRAPGCAGRRG